MKEHPVIIVRKHKPHRGGHHGGAWKVAYADFVTAMMAFFLVMWLVTQSKEVRAAVAGYFREPGVFDYDRSKGLMPGGTPIPAASEITPSPSSEREAMAEAAKRIRQELLRVPELATLRDQIEFSITSEGLRVDLVERLGSSFFNTGSPVLLGASERILAVVAGELGRLSNDVVIEGHTDSRRYANDERYGNWELSADRANSARRVMERQGLRVGQVRAVRGLADTHLHLPDDPLDARNRRVSIIVRSQAAAKIDEELARITEAATPSAPDVIVGTGSASEPPESQDPGQGHEDNSSLQGTQEGN